MSTLARELAKVLSDGAVQEPVPGAYLRDATESRGLGGRADALVLPASADEVASTVAYCYAHDVPVTPRGGGTGFAGGAVPLDGGVVLGLERMRALRELEPALWRAHAEAGMTTATLRRLARENGLLFPPDPGAAEQSQLGGNIACNAGGPHAFKYGVTRAWVLGLEVVLAPGEIVRTGGPVRKDVAGYDLTGLMVGSEGTLGIVTAAWLRLVPAPEASHPVAAAYATAEAGCDAIASVMADGIQAAALEYLDGETLRAAGATFPVGLPAEAGFLVVAEADGDAASAAATRDALTEVLGAGAIALHAPGTRAETDALWRWRDGVSIAVTAAEGGKVSEDIAVPVDRLAEAIDATAQIGARHGLRTCSWGHAGDGNLHSTFMLDRSDAAALDRAHDAAEELFALAVGLGGTLSGEHGIGLVKRDALATQFEPAQLALMHQVKRAFDPKGLLNPAKKLPPA